jgi:hypothetical protein
MTTSKRDNTLFLVYSKIIAQQLQQEGFNLIKAEKNKENSRREVYFFKKNGNLVARAYQLINEHRRMKYEREKAKWLKTRNSKIE